MDERSAGSGATSPPRLAVLVAATASAGAGLIHGAASGSHEGDATLAALFAVCAAVQLAVAGAAVFRPERRVLTALAAVSLLAVAGWLASRTKGWPLVESMADPEEIGAQDLMAAALGGVAAVGALVARARPNGVRAPTQSWAAAVGCSGLLLAVPFLAVGHTHEHGHEVAAGDHAHDESADHDEDGHGHDDEGDHGHGGAELAASSSGDGHDDHDDGHAHGAGGSTSTTSGGHAHDETAAPAAPHDHGSTPAPTVLGDGHQHGVPGGSPTTSLPDDGHGHGHPGPGTTPTTTPLPTGPIISLDDPRLSPAQRAAAVALIEQTKAGMAKFPTVAALELDGYTSIGDGGANGYEHFIKMPYLFDGKELDATAIESVVVKKVNGVSTSVVSAMYMLNWNETMADVPDIAGELTTWHIHDNLCFTGGKLVGLLGDGGCPAGSSLVVTPPMLHVWMVPHPCGPFAGIENHGDTCGHSH